MLESVSLKFTDLTAPLVIPTDGVTIFVGPNNSGKSLVLREIEQDISDVLKIDSKILHSLKINMPTEEQITAELDRLALRNPPGTSPDQVYLSKFSETGAANTTRLMRTFLTMNLRNPRHVAASFLKYFLIRLDGRTRFELTHDRPKGDLLGEPKDMLTHLFQNDELRSQLRDIIYDTFRVYFTIDGLSSHLRIRLSNVPVTSDEQNLNAAARSFHKQALHIEEASDGVRAFIGILCAVFSGEYRAILIDEPEAFLHPPLARRLGYQLTAKLSGGGSLFASTHSPDFIMGCLQASPNIRVVRLEYSQGRSRGRIIDSTLLAKFLRAPLMRSANVISGLFHDGVVVTESDNDRAFYSEIFHRLSEEEKDFPSILFVNAQNKQTIREIMGPLRAFGVPAAAIVDIDILKDGGSDWTSWLKAAEVPSAMHGGLGQIRGDLKRRFVDLGKEMKEGGLTLLDSSHQEAANNLFDSLNNYGVFVVRNGELESWLRHLNVPGKKTDWTLGMLQRLGSDPRSAEYVHPAAGDVWDFLRQTIRWMRDTARKGMP